MSSASCASNPVNTDSDKMTSESKKTSIERQIEENLKRVYDEALNQEVPDRFHDLIAQLKARESKKDDQ